MELTGSAWIYTDNDEFVNVNRLENDPLYTIQAHLTYTFRPGFWAAAGFGYGYDGESILNGVERNDRKGNLVWALSVGHPITRWLGVKFAYIGTRTQESVGQDTDSIALSFSVFW